MGPPRGYLRPPSFMQGVLPVTLLWSASPLSLLSVCAAMAAFERIIVGTDHHHDCLYRGGPGGFTGDYVEYQVSGPSTRRRPCVVGPGSERVERARSMDPQFRELVSRASNRPFGPPPTSF